LVKSPQTQNSTQLPWSASALVLFFCLFGNLGAVGLLGPDEPRYVWIARAMARSGDWVTPRLYGQPWFEKPILYYWLAAIGFRLNLPAEWAARLPSAFAALAAAVAVGWLAYKHYGAKPPIVAPALAAVLFATTVGAIGFARAATPDMLFSAFLALAMASAATVLRHERLLSADGTSANQSNSLPLICFGGFLGFAILAKGPAAIILAGGALAIWILVTRNWRSAAKFFHPFALASFCVIALPWYVLCSLRNPNFLRVFVLQHNFERYLTPLFQHPQPFWFFIPITLLALLPWTVLLWPAAREGMRLWSEKSWKDSPGFFFACWAGFPVLFFSFSQSKLPSYILPAVPPIALLCAIAFADVVASPASQSILKWIGVAIAATWLALGVSAAIWLRRLPAVEHDALRNSVWVAVVIAIVGALATAFLAWHGNADFVKLSVGLVTLLVIVAGFGVLPRLDPFISARWHAQLLRNDRHPERIFIYHLPRAWDYGLAFYFGRELPEWSPDDPNPALVLTTPRSLAEIRKARRFLGDLEENYQGILYVPIQPMPRSNVPNASPR
jgi:4-amino-4-deoxy-L-arabinose transferase-like glycosyltransferase